MSIKNASATLKSNLGTNPYSENRFYIDPRRIEYAPISGAETYYQHASTDSVAGDYSLSQSTSIYMLPFVNPVTAPTTFEIMFKPGFAYNVADSQYFWKYQSQTTDTTYIAFFYDSSADKIGARYVAPAVDISVLLDAVYTSNAQLQQWVRLTLVCDTTSGLTIYSNGGNAKSAAVPTAQWNAMEGMQFLRPSNNVLGYINYGIHINNFAATAAQVANGFYNVPNEQIYFSFQKCGIGRTRCDVTSQVKSYSHEYSDGYKAATFGLSLMNIDGRFSADQYAPFMLESSSYNGTVAQSYLANNKVGISCEQWSKQKLLPDANLVAYYSCDTLPEIPDNAAGTTYLQYTWATTDLWAITTGSLSVSGGRLVGTLASSAQIIMSRIVSFSGAKTYRIKIRSSVSTTYRFRATIDSVSTIIADQALVAGVDTIIPMYIPAGTAVTLISIISISTLASGDNASVDFVYVGSGLYDTLLADNSGNARNATVYAACPQPGKGGSGIYFNGLTSYCQTGAEILLGATSFTYSAWVKPILINGTLQMIISGQDARPWLGIYTSNKFAIASYVSGGGAGTILQSTTTPTPGVWYHVAATHDGSTLRIYVNGALENSLAQTLNPIGSAYTNLGRLTTSTNYYNGYIDEPRIYSRALSASEAYNLYTMVNDHYDTTADSRFEPMFYGTTESGAFSRTTDTNGVPMITISADDQIKDIAQRKVRSSRHWENYYFSRATPSNNSLIHEYIWLASKKEMYNYLGNSGFENTTIGNSWIAGGVSPTFARSNTYALLGTYSGYLTGTSGLNISQTVTMDISVGQIFTFQIYARGPAQNITMRIYEYTDSTNNGGASNVIPISANGWHHLYISYETINSASNRVVVSASIITSGVYFDMAMLTYGGVKTFYVENTSDGTSGIISSSLAMRGTYDQIGIDAEDVSYTHPWAVITKGESPWEMVKQICDATICRYFHIFQGILRYRSYMTSDHAESAIGDLPKASSVSTVEQTVGANKITVEGVIVNTAKAEECIFSARANSDLMNNSYSDTSNTVPNTLSFTRMIGAGETWPDVADYPRGFELRYEEPSAIEERTKAK